MNDGIKEIAEKIKDALMTTMYGEKGTRLEIKQGATIPEERTIEVIHEEAVLKTIQYVLERELVPGRVVASDEDIIDLCAKFRGNIENDKDVREIRAQLSTLDVVVIKPEPSLSLKELLGKIDEYSVNEDAWLGDAEKHLNWVIDHIKSLVSEAFCAMETRTKEHESVANPELKEARTGGGDTIFDAVCEAGPKQPYAISDFLKKLAIETSRREFTAGELKKSYPIKCDKCGWIGLSKSCGGGIQDSDSGDYSYIECPICFSTDLSDPEYDEIKITHQSPEPSTVLKQCAEALELSRLWIGSFERSYGEVFSKMCEAGFDPKNDVDKRWLIGKIDEAIGAVKKEMELNNF